MSILGRQISWKVVMAAMLLMIVLALLPVMTFSPSREIRLIAKDMAFYLENNSTVPNPIIELKAGETIHLVFRNQERGILHDFVIPAAHVATDALHWNEEATLTFDAPDTPGTYEYVCRPHLLMMKGTLRVTP